MITRVTVVCDNPRHAPKVAKVSTFYVVDGKVQTRYDGRDRRDRRRRRHMADPLHPKALDAFMEGAEPNRPSCNLCGRSLPDDPRVNVAVETVAAQGGHEHTCTLTDVAATIAAQRRTPPTSQRQ